MRIGADVAAVLAAGLFVVVLSVFGSQLDGYSHALHPVALPGARGVAGATAFNLLGFVLPGLLGVLVMSRLRGRLDGARWPARIGSWLWLLSALAFAAQGLLPLDPADMDAPLSRLHATAWTLWWLAFAPGGAMLTLGLGPSPRWRTLRIAALAAALLVPLYTLHAPFGLPPGVSQRIGLGMWFASLLAAGFSARRPAQP